MPVARVPGYKTLALILGATKMDISILWLIPAAIIGWVVGAWQMASEAANDIAEAEKLDKQTIGYWGREK
jgi:hypothetical protein